MRAPGSFPFRALGIIVGTVLLLFGVVLLGVFGALWWMDSAPEPVALQPPPPVMLGDRVILPSLSELLQPESAPVVEVEPEPEPEPEVIAEEPANAEPVVVARAAPTTAPTNVPPPPDAIGRLVIPRIRVDTPVVDVALSNGEWAVPRFIAGHLKESVYPGEVGNSVFAGHLTSLTLGNVFEHLKDLRPGDELTYVGKDGPRRFRVTETRAVKNTDTSVLGSKPGQALLTLITCEGRWVPQENDYDQRRVVFAEPLT
jgi:LPXTG-site transpeptidase (sortase) family protein